MWHIFRDLCACDGSQHATQFVTDHHSLSSILLCIGGCEDVLCGSLSASGAVDKPPDGSWRCSGGNWLARSRKI